MNFWEYSFVLRGLEAGMLIAIIAPLIGIFLVLRRYALIADTLSHVSLTGVAVGLLSGVHPLYTAVLSSVVSAVAMERLRAGKRVYGDTALSLFLSGSLALAIVLIGLAHGFNTNLFSYLFGSVLTVTNTDLWVIGVLGAGIVIFILHFYRELLSVSFDEETAAVSGVPVEPLNILFITAAAVSIAIAIPIVGILLVSALMVIPVVAALQLKKGFRATLLFAEAISILCAILGMIVSFYLNLSPGGTIVLLMLFVFVVILGWKKI